MLAYKEFLLTWLNRGVAASPVVKRFVIMRVQSEPRR